MFIYFTSQWLGEQLRAGIVYERHWKLAIKVTGLHPMGRLFKVREEADLARGNGSEGTKVLRQKQMQGGGQCLGMPSGRGEESSR